MIHSCVWSTEAGKEKLGPERLVGKETPFRVNSAKKKKQTGETTPLVGDDKELRPSVMDVGALTLHAGYHHSLAFHN